MNEEIEYAEMLEIPVSTVNVIRKTNKKRKDARGDSQEMKEEVISKINDAPFLTENSFAAFESISDQNQTDFEPNDFPFEGESTSRERRWSNLLLKVEFGLSCALCFGSDKFCRLFGQFPVAGIPCHQQGSQHRHCRAGKAHLNAVIKLQLCIVI